ncbi:response regulator [Daejeonella oryzae]|uniref:response regulator n=1 Tax=Daejeonella oryzae TaxID=1122943 RepID=UPI0004191794|nr:response regulator [Daejeonella oryzae]
MSRDETDIVNILLVDDRPENIISLEALLKSDQVNLISTTSPNHALKLCWENDISIALIDVQMPEMDGFELVEILKSNPKTKDIIVVFVTAISKETKYVVKGLGSGAIDYLYKPLDPYVTIAKIDSLITIVKTQREIKKKNSELEIFQKQLIAAKELAEREKRIKENFLANMSHEIRTPIGGIIGLTHLLKKTDLNSEQSDMVDLLDVSSKSLLGVINDILDISKIEAGKFKIVRSQIDLNELCKSVTGLMKYRAIEKGIELTLHVDPAIPKLILADSLRLNQILMNLLSNAIKFTEAGNVDLSVMLLDKKQDTVDLKFLVSDTGIGIAPNHVNNVFNSFEQADEDTARKFGGTGLGLSIVKKMVELKGGTLSLTTELNKGSTFSFSNTYQFVNQELSESTPSENYIPMLENLFVLVAEDNKINQFMITKMLKNWGVNVEVVDNGSKAVESLRNNNYDVILMDMHMPVMNGLEATVKIRSEFEEPKRNTPIISLSAAVMEDEQQAAMDAGVNDVLTKPFDPDVLRQKIIQLVQKNLSVLS